MIKIGRSLVCALASTTALLVPSVSRADDTGMPAPASTTPADPTKPMTGGSGTNATGAASSPDMSPRPITGSSTPQASTTTTTAATYDENVGAERERASNRPNRPLLVVGSAIFAGTYGASVVVAATSGSSADTRLYVPLVGPWLDLADRPCRLGECGSKEDWNQVLLVGSGIAQAAGFGIALASLFVAERKEVVAAPYRSTKAYLQPVAKPEAHVIPLTLADGGGVGAVGKF